MQQLKKIILLITALTVVCACFSTFANAQADNTIGGTLLQPYGGNLARFDYYGYNPIFNNIGFFGRRR